MPRQPEWQLRVCPQGGRWEEAGSPGQKEGPTWRTRERQEDREGEEGRERERAGSGEARTGAGRDEPSWAAGMLALKPAGRPGGGELHSAPALSASLPFLVICGALDSAAASLALRGRASSMARSPNGFFSFQPSLRDPVADCRLNYSRVR